MRRVIALVVFQCGLVNTAGADMNRNPAADSFREMAISNHCTIGQFCPVVGAESVACVCNAGRNNKCWCPTFEYPKGKPAECESLATLKVARGVDSNRCKYMCQLSEDCRYAAYNIQTATCKLLREFSTCPFDHLYERNESFSKAKVLNSEPTGCEWETVSSQGVFSMSTEVFVVQGPDFESRCEAAAVSNRLCGLFLETDNTSICRCGEYNSKVRTSSQKNKIKKFACKRLGVEMNRRLSNSSRKSKVSVGTVFGSFVLVSFCIALITRYYCRHQKQIESRSQAISVVGRPPPFSSHQEVPIIVVPVKRPDDMIHDAHEILSARSYKSKSSSSGSFMSKVSKPLQRSDNSVGSKSSSRIGALMKFGKKSSNDETGSDPTFQLAVSQPRDATGSVSELL